MAAAIGGAAGAVLAFLFGLVIGSFLNVARYRLPRGLGIVSGRSACPGCGRPIAWYDNVPIVSFVALGRKCRRCGWKIPWVYPAIEGATGITFLLVWLNAAPREIAPYFILGALAIACAGIDFERRIIPNTLTFPGIVLGAFFSFTLFREPTVWGSLLRLVLGVVVGGGSLYLVAVLYKLVRKIEGMGLGDVKFMAMVGAFLGWGHALLTIFLGSVIGAVVGVFAMRRSGKGLRTDLPFGLFLAPAAIVVMIWGSRLIQWYVDLVAVH
jgi:leader peptidase (prepilin peptidase)/N-methyltransferase